MNKNLGLALSTILHQQPGAEVFGELLKSINVQIDWELDLTQGSSHHRSYKLYDVMLGVMLEGSVDLGEIWSGIDKSKWDDQSWIDCLTRAYKIQGVSKNNIKKIIIDEVPDSAIKKIDSTLLEMMFRTSVQSGDGDSIEFLLKNFQIDVNNKITLSVSKANSYGVNYGGSLMCPIEAVVDLKSAVLFIEKGALVDSVILQKLKERSAETFAGERNRKGIWDAVQDAIIKNSPDSKKQEEDMFFGAVAVAKSTAEIKHAFKKIDKSKVLELKTKNGWNVAKWMAYHNPAWLTDFLIIAKLNSKILNESDADGKSAWDAFVVSPNLNKIDEDVWGKLLNAFDMGMANKKEISKPDFWADKFRWLISDDMEEVYSENLPFRIFTGDGNRADSKLFSLFSSVMVKNGTAFGDALGVHEITKNVDNILIRADRLLKETDVKNMIKATSRFISPNFLIGIRSFFGDRKKDIKSNINDLEKLANIGISAMFFFQTRTQTLKSLLNNQYMIKNIGEAAIKSPYEKSEMGFRNAISEAPQAVFDLLQKEMFKDISNVQGGRRVINAFGGGRSIPANGSNEKEAIEDCLAIVEKEILRRSTTAKPSHSASIKSL